MTNAYGETYPEKSIYRGYIRTLKNLLDVVKRRFWFPSPNPEQINDVRRDAEKHGLGEM